MSDKDFPDDLMSLQEAQDFAGIAESTLRRWRREQKELLPTHTPGRFSMVSKADLIATAAHYGHELAGERSVTADRPPTDRRPTADQSPTDRRPTADRPPTERSVSGHRAASERSVTADRPPTERSPSGARPAQDSSTWPPAAQAHIAALEEENASLRERLQAAEVALGQSEVRLETVREEREAYGRIFAGELRQLTDRVAEQNQQTTALQVRASAEVHVARQEAGMLAEQLDDMRNSQQAMSEAQKMLAEQYEARISDLRSSHVRELNAVREGDAAQLNAERAQRAALQESLARTQAEVDRLVAAGAGRDRELAQAKAELAAYRAWAAKGGLGRMFSRPELPQAPQGLLPGPDAE